ncbi:SDR family oxidoreductase [Patescibacteria group bacterium]|nr:SDR family oxidoreductase [Patescibacteria group bacterium]
MNICITGALGHIGSALIRSDSLRSVDRVYLIDNFLTQRYASLFDLPDGITYSFHESDILSDAMRPIIRDSDVVIHLAAITDAETSFHKPEQVNKVNKKGLRHIAKLCAEYGRFLIFPSTTSVYGVQEGLVDESCQGKDLKPQSPYAESKLYGEKYLSTLAKKNGLKFVTLRLGTIFGYSIGMRFHTAVNKFIWQAAIGQPLTVWKTALNQKRPYCDLKDAISAFNHAMENKIFDQEIYNIVTTNLTVKEIIDAIKKRVPGLNITFTDSPIMNLLSYEVSNQMSLEKGFSYSGDLTESIKHSIRKLRNANSSVKITV